MLMYITDEPATQPPQINLVSETEVHEIAEIHHLKAENMQLKAVNRMLVATAWESLRLRGLFSAINDPLGLEMERNEKRQQFKRIELGIRAAIEKADAVMEER